MLQVMLVMNVEQQRIGTIQKHAREAAQQKAQAHQQSCSGTVNLATVSNKLKGYAPVKCCEPLILNDCFEIKRSSVSQRLYLCTDDKESEAIRCVSVG
ncbi:MAG: hypothetical protein ACJAWL_003678 [Motiliproteus sp.]|jgi:hypothetical protein